MDVAFDYIIVLGKALDRDGGITEALKLRLDKAIELFRSRRSDKIIVSGGRTVEGIEYSEADRMAEYLEANGVGRLAIIKESESLNTIANAFFVKQMLSKDRYPSLLVITSETHLKRAEFIFRQVFGEGYHMDFVGSKTPSSILQRELDHEQAAIREVIATFNKFPKENIDFHVKRLLEEIDFKTKPKPTLQKSA